MFDYEWYRQKRKAAMLANKPTLEDYKNYDGHPTKTIWKSLSEDWKCPGCSRSKFQLLRWVETDKNKSYRSWGFRAPIYSLRLSYSHSKDGVERVEEGGFVCGSCKNLLTAFKRKYSDIIIEDNFYFTSEDIASCLIKAEPHGEVEFDFEKALNIYEEFFTNYYVSS